MGRKRESKAVEEGGFKPRLGLPETPAAQPVQRGTVFTQPEPDKLLELTVIVPARNEEDCLTACLQSLVSQSDEVFKLGRDWELMVVDDNSTDQTAEIARSFSGVTVLEAGKLEPGQSKPVWTGKNNAIWIAAKRIG